MLVHNACPVELKYRQYWPSLIRTGVGLGAEAMGFGGSIGGSWEPRDSSEAIGDGVLDPWPRVGGAGRIKYKSPPPEPKSLSTRVMWQNLCLSVYTGGVGAVVVHLNKIECAAANHVILLEGVEGLTTRPRAETDAVDQA